MAVVASLHPNSWSLALTPLGGITRSPEFAQMWCPDRIQIDSSAHVCLRQAPSTSRLSSFPSLSTPVTHIAARYQNRHIFHITHIILPLLKSNSSFWVALTLNPVLPIDLNSYTFVAHPYTASHSIPQTSFRKRTCYYYLLRPTTLESIS